MGSAFSLEFVSLSSLCYLIIRLISMPKIIYCAPRALCIAILYFHISFYVTL
jgi:hypothetical protein